VDGWTVVRIDVRPSPEPVYVGGGEEFFIRAQNTTHLLNTGQAVAYVRNQWRRPGPTSDRR
jgi:hypothetical protein